MESTKYKLTDWMDIAERKDNKEKLNPIDAFLYKYSPASGEDKFREDLLRAINYEDQESKVFRNTEIVGKFIDHCKENNVEISDEIYESFFKI